jgi:pimeloyl-ACP methyl ester carboxylesterase
MTPWILLRGLTRESRHWGEFPHHLCEVTGDAPVICLDLPGNGQLNHMESLLSVEAMADYCHAEMKIRGVALPCRILAMSLGAMVAVAWSQRHPADIVAAVLISTSLRPFSPFHQRLRPANYLRVLHLLAGRVSDEELETAILGMTTRLVAEPRTVIQEWLQWRREHPVSARNALRQLLAAARYRAPRRSPFDRLLLLAGAGDTLVDPRCSRTLAARWLVDFALHPAAGHDLPLDDQAWVLARVHDWLASKETPSPVAMAPRQPLL